MGTSDSSPVTWRHTDLHATSSISSVPTLPSNLAVESAPSEPRVSQSLTSKIVREGSIAACRTFHTGHVRVLLDARDTQSALALIEAVLSPGEGSPRHTHSREDEVLYVQRGRFQVEVGAQSFDLNPGDTLLLPRDVTHALRCISAHPGVFLCWIVCGGSETRFRAEEQALSSGQDYAALAQHIAQLGLSMDEVAADKVSLSSSHGSENTLCRPLRAHEGESLSVFHDCVRILVASPEVGHHYCLTQIETPPLQGIPCHVHAVGHEAFFVQAGRYEFCLDDARIMAHAGDVVWVPAGVAHHFRVVSSSPGKLLSLSVPGGFDHFSRECAALFKHREATPSALTLLGANYDTYLLPA